MSAKIWFPYKHILSFRTRICHTHGKPWDHSANFRNFDIKMLSHDLIKPFMDYLYQGKLSQFWMTAVSLQLFSQPPQSFTGQFSTPEGVSTLACQPYPNKLTVFLFKMIIPLLNLPYIAMPLFSVQYISTSLITIRVA